MKPTYPTLSALLVCVLLSACGGGNSSSTTTSNNDGDTSTPIISTPSPRLSALAAASTSSDASVFGTEALQQDILRGIGGADAEPFAVNSNDTAATAINRAAAQ